MKGFGNPYSGMLRKNAFRRRRPSNLIQRLSKLEERVDELEIDMLNKVD